ncbi:type IV secretory system conjugative DNA transfer family protein [Microbispora sp. H10949]|uniref:type IV secretory system conjugative DNA transfer family protein n=1 Tax=Microbispora sp. H10949 TaxID=2729111 RepID=UPI001601F2C3|nr:TraM recognition domain-containing protein [Microbispora sp. H10949]
MSALSPSTPPTDPAQLDPWAGHLPSTTTVVAVVLLVLLVGVLGQLVYRALIPPCGFASAWEITRYMSARSARRKMDMTRPSLRGGRGVPVSQYAYRLGRSFSPWMVVCCSPEDAALFVGPPGVGKSAALADIVVDAPGAVVYTTSKIADYDTTAAHRANVGPVLLFNPLGLGGVPSTLRHNPIKGCRELDVAMRRGAALLYGARRPGEAGSFEDYFHSNANEVLRAFLLAADLGGMTLLDVQRWANDPTNTEALRIMERYQAPRAWIDALRSRQQVTDRTRDGIFSTLATTLSWLSGPAAAYAVTPAPGEELDMAAFIKARGTLYMVGEDSGAGDHLAPLYTLILADMERAAVTLADSMPARRLDPWMTWALDEVATICPVPLDKWINKWRGHGMLLLAGIQSKAQLYSRWGKSGGDAIWNAAAATVAFGGLKSAEDLRELSQLCGEREVLRTSVQHGPNGPVRSEHEELRPVMPPHKIRQLKRWRALVLYRGAPPVIVRIRRVWKRRDLRRTTPAPAGRSRRPAGPIVWEER